MVRVLICDDQAIVCRGLQVILSSDPEIEVVGTVHDGAEAIEKLETLNPQLILMDLRMPGMNGIQATSYIATHYPLIKVLVLTTFATDEWVYDAIRSGAAGYLLKDTDPDQLIAAVKGTMMGQTFLDPSIAGKLLTHIQRSEGILPATTDPAIHSLSDREREVLQLIAKGISTQQMAKQLYLSEGTVRNYISTLFSKLNVSDRTQAALLAMRYGLVE